MFPSCGERQGQENAAQADIECLHEKFLLTSEPGITAQLAPALEPSSS